MVLAGLGLAFVRVTMGLLEVRLPLVDLSSREASGGRTIDSAETNNSLRFAVAAMISVEATFSTYRRLVRKVCREIGRPEAFVLRPSYAEVRRALEQGDLDVAFVCTGTYVHSLPRKRLKLLVQPEFEGDLQYRSLFIVPTESPATTLEHLRGKIMAFTDPESNTGRLVPCVELAEHGWNPTSFFEKVIYTGSHDHSIEAVALGVVDVAAVDSLVWESAKQQDPSLAERVRVIWASEAFGPPPIVVPSNLDETLENSLRRAFLNLHHDEEGRDILSAIGIKRFVPARPKDYQTAAQLYERFKAEEGVQWP